MDSKQQIIKTVIKELSSESNTEIPISIIEDYFDVGWSILEFTASNNTYSDLSQTGNMNVFKNSKLTDSIKQYYILVEHQTQTHYINKDWIIPMDVVLSQETPAFEFDPVTKDLFEEKNQSNALNSITQHKILLERNAAGHFWLNSSFIDKIEEIKEAGTTLIKTLQKELEK
jgi:hypothetical protein